MGAVYERELRQMLEENGYLAFRGAGSMRCDVVATSPVNGCGGTWHTRTIIIEEKSTQNPKVWYFRGKHNKEQFEYYWELHESGFEVVYAIRHKSGPLQDRWRLHPLHGMTGPNPLRREEGWTFEEYFEV